MFTIKDFRPRRLRYAMLLLVTSSAVLTVFAYAYVVVQVSGSNAIFTTKRGNAATPTPVPRTPPVQTEPVRIRVALGETEILRIATGADSFIVVAPEAALAEQKDRFTISITGKQIGETMLLVTNNGRRFTYVIEVAPRARGTKREPDTPQQVSHPGAVTGSETTTYTHGFDGDPALLRQGFDVNRKISGDRTLRLLGDVAKVVRRRENVTGTYLQKLSVDRFSAELASRDTSIRLLDTQVDISPLTLNNYPLRGIYFSKKRVPQSNVSSDRKPLEVFAGAARPASTFFDSGRGLAVGAIVPFVDHAGFSARAGVMHIKAKRSPAAKADGTVLIFDGRYSPTKSIIADGEIEYANGEMSSRTRFDLRTKKFSGLAEAARLARRSPFNSIGAQPGKRETEAFNFSWRPFARLSASAGFDHSTIERPVNTNITDFSRLQYNIGANIGILPRIRVDFRFSVQRVETGVQGTPSKIEIETRSFSINNTAQFGRNWSNTFQIRFTSGCETKGDAALEKGFNLHDQLRYSWHGGWAAGFINYANKTPSLASIIVHHPQVLPAELQQEFLKDPAIFLRVRAERLRELLGPIDMPVTSNFDTGIRYQQSISRFSVISETRWQSGFDAVRQNQLSVSVGTEARLDKSNTLQLNAWRSFGKIGRSGFTVSFTHRFGSGDGFSPFRIFNFGGGNKLRGRVFHDLNANGQPDPGEPGVPDIEIRIDSRHTVRTDRDGRYEAGATAGTHALKLVSPELGVRIRAVTETERLVLLDPGTRAEVNFGVTDCGTLTGRVFNDSMPSDAPDPVSGLQSVRVILRSNNGFVMERAVSLNGMFTFERIRPGEYAIEIDPATMPADYRTPDGLINRILISPLRTVQADLPISANRAVAGIVFRDTNGNKKFDRGTDIPLSGILVTSGNRTSISNSRGEYVIRALPAGSNQIFAQVSGRDLPIVTVQLDPTPSFKLVDLPVGP